MWSFVGSRRDFDVVTNALLDKLLTTGKEGGYILDGFPRTINQVRLMMMDNNNNNTWPKSLQATGAIKLAVPDKVCETKIIGRRYCSRCNKNFSINGVDFDNYYLPPSHPVDCKISKCSPDIDWTIRDDDKPTIIKERLRIYHQHMDPISNYFSNKNQLLELKPYNGYDDIPYLIMKIENWLQKQQQQ